LKLKDLEPILDHYEDLGSTIEMPFVRHDDDYRTTMRLSQADDLPLGLVNTQAANGMTNLAMKTNELKKNPYTSTFNISIEENMMALFD
jgi:hypothetical protein